MTTRRDLILHIGLPKTGTTALQRDLFPQHPGFIGGTDGQVAVPPIMKELLELRFPPEGPSAWKSERWTDGVRDWVGHAAPHGEAVAIASAEMLSAWEILRGRPPRDSRLPLLDPPSLGNAVRIGPPPVANFLAALKGAVAPEFRLRVILTLREQAEFIGSLYAQLSLEMRNPGQQDLEEKVDRLLASADMYFDWAHLVSSLRAALDEGDLLVCVFEDGMPQIGREIAHWIDPSWSPRVSIGRHNVRTAGPGSWAVPRSSRWRRMTFLVKRIWPEDRLPSARRLIGRLLGGPQRRARLVAERREREQQSGIVLSPELRRRIAATFAASNATTAVLLGRELWEQRR